MNVNGVATPMQGRYYDFDVPVRGGSTFDWSTKNDASIVTGIVERDHKVRVYFPTAGATDEIYVQETTKGGIKSETDTFSVSNVIPFEARAIEGPSLVNAGFETKFSVPASDNDKIYSTWEWTAEKGDISTESESTWETTVTFSNADTGMVTLKAIETNDKDLTDTAYKQVQVLSYCEIQDINNITGSYSGSDGYVPAGDIGPSSIEVTGAEASSSEDLIGTVKIDGINYGWMENAWGETILSSTPVTMNINMDGTLEISKQTYMKTDYQGTEYTYQIAGSGRWDNCGDNFALTIEYNMYNVEDGYEAVQYFYIDYLGDYSYPTFTAEVELGSKISNKFQKSIEKVDRPE